MPSIQKTSELVQEIAAASAEQNASASEELVPRLGAPLVTASVRGGGNFKPY